jgi:Ser/Thr protein kinase RdoA (MazF antagonist)
MSEAAHMEPDEFVERARRLARSALTRWDLAVVGIEPIKVRENAVFRIETDNARAVLRVHRHGYHSDAALRSEFTWMDALSAAGIPVPQVLRSRLGREFEIVETADLDGPRQVDVIRWIEGRPLGAMETGMQGDAQTIAAQYRTIGRIMARMHHHSTAWPIPDGFERHSWDADGLVGTHPLWGPFWDLEALTTAQRRLMMDTRAAVTRELDAFGRAPDRYGLIHADLIPENLLVNGEEVRVIDFDDAGFGWYLFDIATSLYFISGDPHYPAARAALIQGYRSERALPDSMLDHLDTFLAARATTYLGWVHTRQDTQTARDFTPFLVERACAVAGAWLAAR